MSPALHVTNGDVVAPAVAAAAGVPLGDVLPWRDVLHDGPVPAGIDAEALAHVRAAHIGKRGWEEERLALTQLLERDARLAAHPPHEEVVLWFEPDLYDDLQLAQICDRLAGRPGPVTRVTLSHTPRADLRAPYLARQPLRPDGAAFAVLRSPDPRAWETVPAFARLCEELPDLRTGLSRLEAAVLDALAAGPLTPHALFGQVAAREEVPWIADLPLFALTDELAPLVRWDDRADRPRYELTEVGAAVRDGTRTRRPPDRWLGGVRLGGGHPRWAWDRERRKVVSPSAR